MHGPAPAPPPYRPPATGVVVLLRVVFVAVAVGSLGLLAWVAMLRAAIVQRRPLGWWLFGADLLAMIGACVLIVSFPETDWRPNIGVALLLLQIAGAIAYYLVVDIRAVPRPGYGPAAAPFSPPASSPHPYAPPRPPAPEPGPYAHGAHPYPNPYQAPRQDPNPNPYGAPVPPAGPPQDRPQPRRINQVRAELDELSDYLRQEDQR
ncbi:hypothetical protein [Streptomyces sp. NPDC101150]|uniref:hypothetical protein n=1 Tax=Streptomyces sp. NPDC101150 TaxID=3366114 RepID=UPI0037FCE037